MEEDKGNVEPSAESEEDSAGALNPLWGTTWWMGEGQLGDSYKALMSSGMYPTLSKDYDAAYADVSKYSDMASLLGFGIADLQSKEPYYRTGVPESWLPRLQASLSDIPESVLSADNLKKVKDDIANLETAEKDSASKPDDTVDGQKIVEVRNDLAQSLKGVLSGVLRKQKQALKKFHAEHMKLLNQISATVSAQLETAKNMASAAASRAQVAESEAGASRFRSWVAIAVSIVALLVMLVFSILAYMQGEKSSNQMHGDFCKLLDGVTTRDASLLREVARVESQITSCCAVQHDLRAEACRISALLGADSIRVGALMPTNVVHVDIGGVMVNFSGGNAEKEKGEND